MALTRRWGRDWESTRTRFLGADWGCRRSPRSHRGSSLDGSSMLRQPPRARDRTRHRPERADNVSSLASTRSLPSLEECRDKRPENPLSMTAHQLSLGLWVLWVRGRMPASSSSRATPLARGPVEAGSDSAAVGGRGAGAAVNRGAYRGRFNAADPSVALSAVGRCWAGAPGTARAVRRS